MMYYKHTLSIFDAPVCMGRDSSWSIYYNIIVNYNFAMRQIGFVDYIMDVLSRCTVHTSH